MCHAIVANIRAKAIRSPPFASITAESSLDLDWAFVLLSWLLTRLAQTMGPL